jgi:hypothetical protein
MKHLLAFVRLQPADQDDEAFVMLIAQPAGERGDIELLLGGSERKQRLAGEIFLAGLESFLELDIEVDRLISIPGGKISLSAARRFRGTPPVGPP